MNSANLQEYNSVTLATKINIYAYTNNEQYKKEIKILFTIGSKGIKYLEINLTKEAKTCTLKTAKVLR